MTDRMCPADRGERLEALCIAALETCKALFNSDEHPGAHMKGVLLVLQEEAYAASGELLETHDDLRGLRRELDDALKAALVGVAHA